MIAIHIQNTNKDLTIPFGMTVQDLAKQENIHLEYPVMGALINNKVRECAYRIHKPCTVQFFDMTSSYGHLMYIRSVYFILHKAVKDILPKQVKLKILHSISGGKYCELDHLNQPLNQALVNRLYKRMKEIVDSDLPIERMELPTNEAVEMFKEQGLEDKYELLRHRSRIYTSIYKLGDTVNYYFGNLAPSTGLIDMFSLELYESGMLLKAPNKQARNPINRFSRKKLTGRYKEKIQPPPRI